MWIKMPRELSTLGLICYLWVFSSAGERFLHTEEVAGPIPVALTIALFANLAHPVEQLICNQ